MKVAIINDTRTTHHYGCMLVMENLLRLLGDESVDVAWTWPVSVDWRRHKRKILNMPAVDAIIINGEGTIHHNYERRFSQALLDFVEFATDTLKVPCYVVNATLHANNSEAYAKLARARAVYVRDKGSLRELEQNGNTGAYVPDLTFAANSAHGHSAAGEKVLVVDSAVKQDSAALLSFAARRGFDFRSMVVARPSNARFLRSPRPWVKNVIRWMKTDRKISTAAASYIADLQKYGFVITGRYHTVTMCLKNQIPFIALESNTPKVRFLLEDVTGDAHRSVAVDSLENIGSVGDFAFSHEEIESITAFTSEAEQRIRRMIGNIIADVRTGCAGAFRY